MEVEASSFCPRVVWESSIMPHLLGWIDSIIWEERALCIVSIHTRIASPGSKWFLQANEYRGSFEEEEIWCMWQIEYPDQESAHSVRVSPRSIVGYAMCSVFVIHISVALFITPAFICLYLKNSMNKILQTRRDVQSAVYCSRCSWISNTCTYQDRSINNSTAILATHSARITTLLLLLLEPPHRNLMPVSVVVLSIWLETLPDDARRWASFDQSYRRCWWRSVDDWVGSV